MNTKQEREVSRIPERFLQKMKVESCYSRTQNGRTQTAKYMIRMYQLLNLNAQCLQKNISQRYAVLHTDPA